MLVSCPIDVALLKTNQTIVVTSGFRTFEHNKKVGGVKDSYHLQRCGARDVLKSPIKDKERFKSFLKENDYRIIEYEKHYHIDIRGND